MTDQEKRDIAKQVFEANPGFSELFVNEHGHCFTKRSYALGSVDNDEKKLVHFGRKEVFDATSTETAQAGKKAKKEKVTEVTEPTVSEPLTEVETTNEVTTSKNKRSRSSVRRG